MRAGWMQVLPGAPQTTPRGELWAFILALSHTRGPLLYFADYMGLVRGFSGKTLSLPLWTFGEALVSDRSSRGRKRLQRGGSPCWQPRHGRGRGRGTREAFHSCWATAWPTRWRACQRTLWNATKDRCFLTHIWSNLPRQSGRRAHLVNLAAHQVEPSERAPRESVHQPRPKAGTKRPAVVTGDFAHGSQSRTTTIIASPVMPRYHKTGSTLGFSVVPVRQCSTCPLLSLLGAVHCTSLTRSPSWTTDVLGYARPADTYLV